MESVVLNEEFARAEAPLRADFFGDTLVGPTILQWGTEEQKKQFIPGILDGTISWCQGFSEPDAGSDLASLKTRAELDGDEWVINGQKVWTTQAQFADYIFLLARTDPDAPKHAGISYLLVPDEAGRHRGAAHRPGGRERRLQRDLLHQRPLPAAERGRRREQRLEGGDDHPGLRAGLVGHHRPPPVRAASSTRSSTTARKNGKASDPLIRQRLAKAWTKVKIMEINGYRSLTDSLNGTHHMAALGACNKMFWSEYHQETMDLAMDILGLDGQILTGDPSDIVDVAAQAGTGRLPGERPAGLILLLAVGDHLGRHGGDPAQHRRRAGPRPAQGPEAGSGCGRILTRFSLVEGPGRRRGGLGATDPPTNVRFDIQSPHPEPLRMNRPEPLRMNQVWGFYMRRMIISVAALAALATPASLLTMSSLPAGAVTTPKSIPCTKVSGTASAKGVVTITNCTVPAADKVLYKSAAAPVASLITGKGKITWSSSKKTTQISVTFGLATKNGCSKTVGSNEYNIKGKVVKGGTAATTVTPVNQPIAMSICLSKTNVVTLAPGTKAEI